MKKFKNIEFHTSPEGEILINEEDKLIRALSENDTELLDYFADRIRNEYPEAFAALSKAYEKQQRNFMFFNYVIVRRFIRCNFSNFDTLAMDLDNDGIFHFEQVACPMRGECPGYKKICQPKFNSKLSDREIQVLKLYCSPMEIDPIADRLCLSPFTIEEHLKNIRRKTGCTNKAELMKYVETYLK
jgi:DNA-binding CsgD family transcriptional regulator